jgi:hypothetical protein
MDTSVLKGLSKGSQGIAHLSDTDKDLVMLKKDECFPKATKQSKDAEPGRTDSDVDEGR